MRFWLFAGLFALAKAACSPGSGGVQICDEAQDMVFTFTLSSDCNAFTSVAITETADTEFGGGDGYIFDDYTCENRVAVLTANLGPNNVQKATKDSNETGKFLLWDSGIAAVEVKVKPLDCSGTSAVNDPRCVVEDKMICDGTIYVSGSTADGPYMWEEGANAETYTMGVNAVFKHSSGTWQWQDGGTELIDSGMDTLAEGTFGTTTISISCDKPIESCDAACIADFQQKIRDLESALVTAKEETVTCENNASNLVPACPAGQQQCMPDSYIDPTTCPPSGVTCPTGQTCMDSAPASCPTGETCQGDCPVAETCPTGQTCMGDCPDVNPMCPTGEMCMDSQPPTCPTGETCKGDCQTGSACPTGETCQAPTTSCADDLSKPVNVADDYWFCDELLPSDCDHTTHGHKVRQACGKLCDNCAGTTQCDEKYHTQVLVDGAGLIYCDQLYDEECADTAIQNVCCKKCADFMT